MSDATDTADTLPPLHRILTPDEFHQAQGMSPEALATNPFPVIPPGPSDDTGPGGPGKPGKPKPPVMAPADVTRGMNPNAQADRGTPQTGLARILTQYVAVPILDHPLTTAAITLAPGAGLAMTGLMGKDLLEYAAQRWHEAGLGGTATSLAKSPEQQQRDVATAGEPRPRISGEQAAVEAALLGVAPLAHAGIKAAKGMSSEAAGGVTEPVTPATEGLAPRAPTAAETPTALDLALAGSNERFSGLPVTAEARAAIKTHVDNVVDAWEKIVAPANRTPESKQAANILRATTGEMAAQYEQAAFKLDEFRRAIEPLPESDKLGFIDAIEGGRSQPSPEFQPAADIIRKTLDDARDQIIALGTGKLEHFIQDYFPHVWTDPDRAADVFATMGAKRPMEGSKAFLKQRTIPTTLEGIQAGLEPVSYNPVDLTLLKLREMQRYLMAHQSLNEMKDAGLVKFVRSGVQAPDGYTRINDKIATVFGPREGAVKLPEGALTPGEPKPNAALRDEVGKLRRNLKGVASEHLQDEWQRLAELNNAEEALHSSVQEAGYREDYNALPSAERTGRSGRTVDAFGNKIKGQAEDLPDASGEMDPDVLAQHNQIIKDYNKSQIVRKARARAMDRIEAELATRPGDEDFTAKAIAFRAGKGEMPGLRPMRPEDVRVQGLRIMGEHWAPEPVATVVNNYLSPGLRGNPIYDAYRGLGNTLNQAQLGLSAFHLGFTSMDASVSRAALGLEYIASGKPLTGLKEMASAPAAPITNALLGKRIRAAYLNPDAASPDMLALANAVKEAGGRVRQDSFYQNSAPEKLVNALRAAEYGKATAYSIPAALEWSTGWLMNHVVPMQKLGVFGDLAKKVLADLPPDATLAERRAELAKAWDSVDNRMGQVVYDNLFWNRTFKDLSMASVRSVGWNLGTIRELGGGLGDIAGAGTKLATGKAAEAELTHRAAYVMALPLTVGLYGAVYQLLRTGEAPTELRDYFYPKTGEVDADGNSERVQLASYMKDMFAYAGSPWGTVKHKVAPLLSMTYEMLQNEDFYGDEIRNPTDPLVKQVAQEAEYVAKSFEPFSFRNMGEQTSRGDQSMITKYGNIVGITPAPRSKVRSEAQNLMADYLKNAPSGATPEEVKIRRARAELLSSLRGITTLDAERVNDAIESGKITPPDIVKLLKRAGMTPAQEKFKRLTFAQAVEVFKKGRPDEQAKFAQILVDKARRAARAAGVP